MNKYAKGHVIWYKYTRNNVRMLGSKVMHTFLARKEGEPGYEAIITPYM